MGFPPNSEVKICVPKRRSVESMPIVAAKIGKAKMTRIIVTKTDQIKMGILIRVIPGQRIFKIVTKKLIPESKVPTPEICTLQSQ